MKNQLPPICNGVVILDFAGQQIVKYADVASPETSGAWRKPNGPQRWYVAHFHDGMTRNFSSPFPVHHLPQSLIECLHRTAREMPLTLLADLYASILKLPQRKKGEHHGT